MPLRTSLPSVSQCVPVVPFKLSPFFLESTFKDQINPNGRRPAPGPPPKGAHRNWTSISRCPGDSDGQPTPVYPAFQAPP